MPHLLSSAANFLSVSTIVRTQTELADESSILRERPTTAGRKYYTETERIEDFPHFFHIIPVSKPVAIPVSTYADNQNMIFKHRFHLQR